MAFKYFDRVKENATPSGTGTITLGGTAANGYRTFTSVFTTGDTCLYCIQDNTAYTWEIGVGTYTTSGNTLSRTTVLSSSNAGSLVSFAGNAADVFITDASALLLGPSYISTPPAGTLQVYSQSVANRPFITQVASTGEVTEIQPGLARNKVGYWNPPGNATTVPAVFGFTAFSTVGTATARNVATTNVLTRMRRLGNVTTSTTAGLLCQQYLASAQFTTGAGSGVGGFTFVARFANADASTVSGARMFCGMSSNTSAATNVEPNTLTNSMGIAQLSTDATQWYFVYGGSTSQTAVALGTGLGAPTLVNTAFEIAIYCSPVDTTVNYQVTNIGSGATVTGSVGPSAGTTTPASTTLLAPRIWRCNNATALVAGYDLCSMYIETDN